MPSIDSPILFNSREFTDLVASLAENRHKRTLLIGSTLCLGLLAHSVVKMMKIKKRKEREKKVREIAHRKKLSVCIIGGGMSGICSGIKFKEAGIDFDIFEISPEVGGTWFENSYPAAGCDVPAQIYSFSFNINTNWSTTFVKRDEILDYFKDTVNKYKIRDKIKFRHKVIDCLFKTGTQKWYITYENLETGEKVTKAYNFVISATGQLNKAKVPQIPGIEHFQGAQFHTSHWNHGVSLKDKNVVAVGTGPSAIQAFPEVAQETKSFSLIYRSGTYFMDRAPSEVPYSSFFKGLLTNVPGLALLRYYLTVYGNDLMYTFLFRRHENDEEMTFVQKVFRQQCLRKLKKNLSPSFEEYSKRVGYENKAEYERYMNSKREQLIAQLTPHTMPGCKRLALSSKWYEMFTLPNVKLVKKEIKRIESNAVVVEDKETSEEEAIPADVILWATGFHATELNEHIPFRVEDRNGAIMTLKEKWEGYPRAYKGVAVDGFPNLFILYGPNTNLGHNTITFMVERQVEYMVGLVSKALLKGYDSISVDKTVLEDYNKMLQENMKGTVFTANCSNWYTTADGHYPINWPLTVREFKKQTDKVDIERFIGAKL